MWKMRAYSDICPNDKSLGLIVLKTDNDFNLPAGAYAFVDLYCDNPNCNCKSVLVDIYKVSIKSINRNDVIKIKSSVLATLSLSWENIQADWDKELKSSRESYDRAVNLLEFFKIVYKERFASPLRQRYSRYRQIIKEKNTFDSSRCNKLKFEGKIGRNDPCFCGSGIKFKKCCGGHSKTID